MKDANVLSSLPRTRPHRRSERRPARASSASARAATTERPALKPAPKPVRTKSAKTSKGATTAVGQTAKSRRAAGKRLPQPAQPVGVPRAPSTQRPVPPSGTNALGTAVQAAAELAEIGLSLGTRAVRSALARVPRP